MADPYLTPASFRKASLDAACVGLDLTDDEANNSRLTTQIESVSLRVDAICGDHFATLDEFVLTQDVYGDSATLELDMRCTSLTTVKTIDALGNKTTQNAGRYRLRSSLDPTGSFELRERDYLEIVPYSGGLSSVFWAYYWPCGPQTVEITGDFGWLVTPGDIKRAVALLVWDQFKREAGDVRRASRWARGDLTVERATDSLTGIPEADELLREFIRGDEGYVRVG